MSVVLALADSLRRLAVDLVSLAMRVCAGEQIRCVSAQPDTSIFAEIAQDLQPSQRSSSFDQPATFDDVCLAV